MTTFGMPYFLEDSTGQITGSDFLDLHNRMHLSLKPTLQDAHHSAYIIYDLSSRASGGRGGLLVPLATLDFGPHHSLGSIKIGDGEFIPMGHYLMKTPGFSGSKSRKFKAADGQEYRWTLQADGEWQCINAKNNYHVATYSMKPAGEPQYPSSSGCMLTVEEAYPHLVGELLASLVVMRHIVKHDL